jgi:steroid 5-alpha reductase family enzyme
MRSCAGSGPIRPTPGGCSTAACGATPRHPNYFGDAVVWFGLWLLACSHWLGLVVAISPVYMTNMLVRHTGKKLLEKHMARSKGAAYAEYIRRTSGFVPWPPR